MIGITSSRPPLDFLFPIGALYLSVDGTDPSVLFGGTWEQVKDKFLLCSGNVYENGSIGGNTNTTLSVANIPAHTHTRGTMNIIGEFRAYSDYNLNNTEFQSALKGPFWYYTDERDNYGTASNVQDGSSDACRQIHFDASRAWTGETSSVGSGASFSNLPPYIAITVWKRVN